MSDEEQVRDLLQRATGLPDEITPPVRELIGRGRRRRKVRSAQRTLGVGIVAALAIATPQVIHTIDAAPPPSTAASAGATYSGPSGAQLAKYTWSTLPPSPLGPRDQPTLVAAGRYVIELGGLRKGNTNNDGAAFDLKTRRWHKIAAVRANVGFDNATTVWTGSELFVTNGQVASCLGGEPVAPCLAHAGLYNPKSNRWTVTMLPRKMEGLFPTAAVWTGHVVVLAALDAHHGRLAVGAYNPATNRWQVITPRLPDGHPPAVIRLVATPYQVIMWSQWLVNKPNAHSNDAGVDVLGLPILRPNHLGPWHNMTGKWAQNRGVGPPVSFNAVILFPPSTQWCSLCTTSARVYNGFLANAFGLRRIVTIPLGPVGGTLPDWLWAGRTIISVVHGRGNPLPFKLTNIADDDLATNTWRLLAAAPGDAHTDALPVWTGRELLVVTEQGTTLALHR